MRGLGGRGHGRTVMLLPLPLPFPISMWMPASEGRAHRGVITAAGRPLQPSAGACGVAQAPTTQTLQHSSRSLRKARQREKGLPVDRKSLYIHPPLLRTARGTHFMHIDYHPAPCAPHPHATSSAAQRASQRPRCRSPRTPPTARAASGRSRKFGRRCGICQRCVGASRMAGPRHAAARDRNQAERPEGHVGACLTRARLHA